MDSSEIEEYYPSCKENCLLLIKQVWVGLANFFQCDQAFKQYQITPHAIQILKQEHTFLENHIQQRSEFGKEAQDHMLLEIDEATRFGQLSTWKWWKQFFCCYSQQAADFELETQIDLSEAKQFEQDKEEKQLSNNCKKSSHANEKNTEKEDIIELDPEFFEYEKPNAKSTFSQINNDSIVQLKPVQQKVNPISNFPLKKKRRTNKSNNNSNSNSNKSLQKAVVQGQSQKLQHKVGQYPPSFAPLQPNHNIVKVQQSSIVQQKIKQQQISPFNIPLDNVQHIRKQSQDIIYQSPRSAVNKKRKTKKINVQDDFDQLDQHIIEIVDQPKNITSSKNEFIHRNLQIDHKSGLENTQSLIQINESQIILPNFINNLNNFEPQLVFENSEVVAEDGIRKRKKKARNIFEEQITTAGNLEITQQQLPEDSLEKKKRKKRRRPTVLNQQKGQQQRAIRRKQQEEEKQKEQLQVIIYSDGDD